MTTREGVVQTQAENDLYWEGNNFNEGIFRQDLFFARTAIRWTRFSDNFVDDIEELQY